MVAANRLTGVDWVRAMNFRARVKKVQRWRGSICEVVVTLSSVNMLEWSKSCPCAVQHDQQDPSVARARGGRFHHIDQIEFLPQRINILKEEFRWARWGRSDAIIGTSSTVVPRLPRPASSPTWSYEATRGCGGGIGCARWVLQPRCVALR